MNTLKTILLIICSVLLMTLRYIINQQDKQIKNLIENQETGRLTEQKKWMTFYSDSLESKSIKIVNDLINTTMSFKEAYIKQSHIISDGFDNNQSLFTP